MPKKRDDEVDTIELGGADWIDNVVISNCVIWGREYRWGELVSERHDLWNPETQKWEPVEYAALVKHRRK